MRKRTCMALLAGLSALLGLTSRSLAQGTVVPPPNAGLPPRAGPPAPAPPPCLVDRPCPRTRLQQTASHQAGSQQRDFQAKTPRSNPVAASVAARSRVVVTSGFGWRPDPFGGGGRDFHAGVDLAVPPGTPVFAPTGGRVIQTGQAGGYGLSVMVRSGTYTWRVAHLSAVAAEEGAYLSTGAYIGRSGATGRVTGPHLHFEVRRRGQGPIPPGPFLKAARRAR